MKKNSLKVAICGFLGYSGQILAKLIAQHPYLELTTVITSKSKSAFLAEIPFAMPGNSIVVEWNEALSNPPNVDIICLATPAAASIEFVTSLQNSSITIIDLSGAFRLPISDLEAWYDLQHEVKAYSNGACYGLLPWNPSKSAKLIANPGCYPTCALMALIPLLKNHLIDAENIIIDAKSGTSGAGKKINPDLTFTEMMGNFYPYKIGNHQHTPEIQNQLQEFTGVNCEITFTTHLLPLMQGISMSIYAKANSKYSDDKVLCEAINKAYQQAYENYPLLKFCALNQGNATSDKYILSLKTVVNTAETHIGFYVKNKKIFVFASIDNLYKGAASQAIENINAIYDLPFHFGLTSAFISEENTL